MVLEGGVLLIKDNLARRNWIGSKVCSFCNWEETIQHLFFDCAYARFFWRAIHLVFGLAPPKDVDDLFNHWLKQGGRKPNLYLLTGISAMCWVIWLSRNDIVFNKCQPKTFLQVSFRGTYWLCHWAQLQRSENKKERLIQACRLLEMSALCFFTSHRWPFSLQIGFQ